MRKVHPVIARFVADTVSRCATDRQHLLGLLCTASLQGYRRYVTQSWFESNVSGADSSVRQAGDVLLITGFFGIVKIISCGFFLIFLVERIGRRGALLGGASLMGTYMLIIAVLTATHPPSPNQGFTPTGVASVAMIYLEASMCKARSVCARDYC